MTRCSVVILLAIGVLLATTASAQAPWDPGWEGADVPEWGTQSSAVYTVAAGSFLPTSSIPAWSTDANRYLWTSQASTLQSGLPLPAGASIVALELEACDTTSAEEAIASLVVCPHRGLHACTTAESVGTGELQSPGCDGFFVPVDPPVTVDNLVNTYLVEVWLGDSGSATRFLSVLVSYRLQVSPKPATATFGDVSTGYWAFQHIEALAASGITAGCGGGDFCPESPLTRAQMAVFLAKALGLHWAY